MVTNLVAPSAVRQNNGLRQFQHHGFDHLSQLLVISPPIAEVFRAWRAWRSPTSMQQSLVAFAIDGNPIERQVRGLRAVVPEVRLRAILASVAI